MTPSDEPPSTIRQTESKQAAAGRLSLATDSPPADVPGYRIERYVGAGAFGQIWHAFDVNTGRPVAVKFYLHRDGVNWSLLSREVKSLVQLSSDRFIVQVLQVGWDATVPYYVMEWVAGGSLEDHLAATPKMAPAAAMKMFRQILIGLNHCHGKGVLHCDLKPANILLGDDLEPRLTDFGQSRLSTDQTPALGTLFYMAPEQADLTAAPDARWDVYAAGAILYRMLTGEAPHRDRESINEIEHAETLQSRLAAYRARIASAPPPTTILAEQKVDRSLIKIVTKCLHADPDGRYANVQSIIDDMNQREIARARRPLYVMGIIGPVLIALLTGLFAYRTISTAGEQTMSAVRKEAFISNTRAASLAARSMELELDQYFDLIGEEAGRSQLIQTIRSTLEDPDIRQMRAEIRSMPSSIATMAPVEFHERFLAVPARRELDRYMHKLLDRYHNRPGEPQLATAFIVDPLGTILSIAYREEVSDAKNSAGRNFAYRTYFHGGKEDLDPSTTIIGDVPPLRRTRLSAPFRSTATGLWKVAVTTPIRWGDDKNVDALFVATINLGDFKLLDSANDKQFTVVIDAREGDTRGTILQHPAMASLGGGAQGAASLDDYRIDADTLEALFNGGEETYQDPITKIRVQSGNNDQSVNDNAWIAAVSAVSLPRVDRRDAVSPGDDTADLMVLVQYRLASVLQPVRRLQRTLLIEGFLGLLSIGLVSVAVWYFAGRLSRIDAPGLAGGPIGAGKRDATKRRDDDSNGGATKGSGFDETLAG